MFYGAMQRLGQCVVHHLIGRYTLLYSTSEGYHPIWCSLYCESVVKFWPISVVLISVFSFDSLANDVLDTTPLYPDEKGCASIVCKNVIEPQSVDKADDFPERAGNETLSFIGSFLFAIGEMGLAENLQEEEFSGTAKN
ncbi:hypothetical protein L9W79_17555 [Vibrio aestuarianus]|nr:hypothetical protein [Vibrio aestuarianus]